MVEDKIGLQRWKCFCSSLNKREVYGKVSKAIKKKGAGYEQSYN